MAKELKEITTIRDLTPDTVNANKHSQRGMGMMETSLQECGFGDSLTVDKHGNVISGNGRLETLSAIDMQDAIVVKSDGTRPIVHQRTDLDLKKDNKAKRLAILQNRVGQVNLDWDAEVLAQLAAEGVELDDLWNDNEIAALLGQLNDPDDPTALYNGMPEFEQGDAESFRKIIIHFDDNESVEDFARKIGQTITEKTRFLWHPYKAHADLKALSVGHES